MKKAEAIEHARRCAHHDEESGRDLVHCFSGAMGADWDLEDVIQAINDNDEFGFALTIWGECFYIVRRGPERRSWIFDTVTPEKVTKLLCVELDDGELELVDKSLRAQYHQDEAWLRARHTTSEERNECLNRMPKIRALLAKLDRPIE